MCAHAGRLLPLLRRVLGIVGLALGTVVAVAMLLPAVLGYERYVITGGSMAGTYERGSLVIAEEVPVSELDPGDVITFVPPPRWRHPEPVTHRIVAVAQHRGERVFRTRGDANPSVDPWRFVPDGPTQARTSAHLPYLGYAVAALSVRELRILLIGVPALLVALTLAVGLVRDAGRAAAGEHS